MGPRLLNYLARNLFPVGIGRTLITAEDDVRSQPDVSTPMALAGIAETALPGHVDTGSARPNSKPWISALVSSRARSDRASTWAMRSWSIRTETVSRSTSGPAVVSTGRRSVVYGRRSSVG